MTARGNSCFSPRDAKLSWTPRKKGLNVCNYLSSPRLSGGNVKFPEKHITVDIVFNEERKLSPGILIAERFAIHV